MYNNDAQRCLTGEVRLSYVNLDKPRQPQGGVGDAKYSATLLIPKTDTATIADFRAAIQAAAQIGAGTLWGGIIPPNLDSIIHDGDGVRKHVFVSVDRVLFEPHRGELRQPAGGVTGELLPRRRVDHLPQCGRQQAREARAELPRGLRGRRMERGGRLERARARNRLLHHR